MRRGSMESTNYMNPKYWLIGVGAVNLLFSLYNFFDASGVAEIALTDHSLSLIHI